MLGLAVLSWPVPGLTPQPGLDPAYGYALAEAARQGLRWGSQLVFTYGPLGFLSVPQLWWTPAAAAALVFTFAVHLGLCVVVYKNVARIAGWFAATLAVLGSAWLTSVTTGHTPGAAAEVLALVVLGAALLALDGVWRSPWLAAAGVLAASIDLLVKLDSGLLVAAIVVVSVAAASRRWWLAGLSAAGSIAVLSVALWALDGQPLSGLPAMLRTTWSVIGGWTGALAYEQPGLGWQYPVAALLVAIVAAVLLAPLLARRPGRAQLAGRVLITAGSLFVAFKHGFVRHDAHAVEFFTTELVLLLVLPRVSGSRWEGWLRLAGVAGVGVVINLGSFGLVPSAGSFAQGGLHFAEQVAQVSIPSLRHQVQARGRRAIKAVEQVPAGALAVIGTRGVQVDPSDTSVAWAYGLAWHPVPVFQTNVAYTPALDQLNANALRGSNAPAAILLSSGERVGNVVPAQDSPAYNVAELCHYRTAYASPRWSVLLRSVDHCGAPRTVARVVIRPGQSVALPRVGARQVLTLSVRLPGRAVLAKLRQLAFKPSRQLAIVLDGTSYLLYRARAVGPLLVYVPPLAREPVPAWPAAHSFGCTGFSGEAVVTVSSFAIRAG